MGVDSQYPTLDLGPHVDDLFMRHGYDSQQLVLLLQARVHAQNIEQFAYHVGLLLGFTTHDAVDLWHNIKLPDLSYLSAML